MAPLKDFRGKLTPETWCWLEALSRSTGDDQQRIVRDVLHDWASKHLRAAKVADRLMAAEGFAGNRREGGV